MSAWKSILGSVPTTEPDGKVVSFHDPLAPPPALLATWREVIEIRRRIAHKVGVVEAARHAMAKAEREIAEERRRLAEVVELWNIMTAPVTQGDGDESANKDPH